MGGLFSKQKKDGGKKFYQFWSKEPQEPPASPKPVNTLSTTKLPTAEWTDVPLQVPDLPDNMKKDMEVPVPPPRKHRGKSQSMKSIVVELNTSKEIKPPRAVPESPIPVEEPMIIPKKEPIHICDGTHHHVTNIANGKVIQSGRVSPKSKHVVTSNLDKSTRPKNLSTVSLPNYEELSVKKINRHVNSREVNPKKKPKRHISVTSLPTEDKVFLSSTTAARLENYMMRCKSFGSLPPKKLLEKLQNDLEYGSESDDSFEGLDAWDMEVFEHNAIRSSPLVPRCRLSAPSAIPAVTPDSRLPTTIEEVDEVLKNKAPVQPQGIITLKKTEGRRESIDDFFDTKAENPVTTKLLKVKNENYLGRRGSDGFFGYDKRCYPFKNAENDPSFKSDTFFSNALLQSESEKSKLDMMKQRRKSAGAALHRIESYDDDDDEDRLKSTMKMFENDDDLLNTFQKFYKKDNKTNDSPPETDDDSSVAEEKDNKINTKSTEPLKSDSEAHSPPKDNNFNLGETSKPTKVEHSSLLKFIQENALDNSDKPSSVSDVNKNKAESTLPSLAGKVEDRDPLSNSNTESLCMMVPT